MKKVDVIADMQFGSTGKGLFASYLDGIVKYEVVISINQPNAGHTAYDNNGVKFVHKVLPSAVFNGAKVCIGPGAVFSIQQLRKELDYCRLHGYEFNLMIHESAVILNDSHREKEQSSLSGISSTMQGSSAAAIEKMQRSSNTILVSHNISVLNKELHTHDWYMKTSRDWMLMLNSAKSILVEGSQGYSLGLNAGFYPYCTSRDCTPARMISEAGVPAKWLRHVYGIARTYPIRVGNTPDGYSGDWYSDQKEISFSDIGVETETTTVTGRPRRIATFSISQIVESMMMLQPDFIFLNFCNYINNDSDLDELVGDINHIAKEIGCGGVTFKGFGPYADDISYSGWCPRYNDDSVTIESLRNEILEWVDRVLPERSPLPAALKLAEESAELSAAIYSENPISIENELADVMIVAMDLSYMLNLDISKIVHQKLQDNIESEWNIKDSLLKRIK